MSTNKHYFLALPVPDPVKEMLSNWSIALQTLPFDYKEWVYKEDFHLTLKFLGGVSDSVISNLTSEVGRVVASFSPFSMKGKGMGIFGNVSSPRVLWAAIESDPLLINLQKDLDVECSKHGFQLEDRPYRPHITIAKKWREGTFVKESLPALPAPFFNSWTVDSIALYTIHPSRKPKYEVVARFSLGELRE